MSRAEKEDGFFENLGVDIASGNVEIGKTYPIFGMITKLYRQVDGHVIAELNNSISAHLNVSSDENFEILKQRSFETGIFISRVIAYEPALEVECQAVIFGKTQAYNA